MRRGALWIPFSAGIVSAQSIKRGALAAAAGGGSVWETTGVGFAFRATPSYVTDGTNITAVTGDVDTNYKWENSGGVNGITRTIGGAAVTFGWWGEGSTINFCNTLGCQIIAENNSTSVDPRLAGLHYTTPGTSSGFRVTLPSTGTYRITAAIGKATGSSTSTNVIYENAASLSLKATLDSATSASTNQFVDASGTLRTSDSDWVTNQQTIDVVFTSTDFILKIGDGGNYCVLNYLNIKKIS